MTIIVQLCLSMGQRKVDYNIETTGHFFHLLMCFPGKKGSWFMYETLALPVLRTLVLLDLFAETVNVNC